MARRYSPMSVVTGPGLAVEYAMVVVDPHPRRRESRGDVIMCGLDEDGKRRQEHGLKLWEGWAPMERVIMPWIITGRFDLVDEAGVTAPRPSEKGMETMNP